ncbi:MAG: hypothetical protein HC818_00010 [Synechococcaceae cyanobacterium RM1_1_27]|nr:hypothetical protein [Synechococcaceae cyanobacterium RM1_1_27]
MEPAAPDLKPDPEIDAADPPVKAKQPPPDQSFDDQLAARESGEQFDLLKGDLPCLDSSANCIQQLQALAVTNSNSLKQLGAAITTTEDAIKLSAQPNTWKDIQVFKPLVLGVTGGLLGGAFGVVDNLASSASDQQKNLIQSADLQTRIATLQRQRIDAQEVIRQQVLQEVIRFDDLYQQANTSTTISLRETARMKVIEVTYRLGGSVSTSEFVGLVNNLDQKKLAAANARSAARGQAERVKRLVLSGEE